MEVASSGIGSAAGYASPLQNSATRPQDGSAQGINGQPKEGPGGPQQAPSGENQPIQDPTATRGRNLNISV
jgi:hypothetical protein